MSERVLVASRSRPIIAKSSFASAMDDRMDVIDTKTLAVSRSVPNVLDPELVAIDPVGKRVYAANEEDSQVTVIDRASGKIVGTVGVGAEPEGLSISPDLSTVVNTSELTSMAHFIDTKTLTIEDKRARRSAPARGAIYP